MPGNQDDQNVPEPPSQTGQKRTRPGSIPDQPGAFAGVKRVRFDLSEPTHSGVVPDHLPKLIHIVVVGELSAYEADYIRLCGQI